MTLDVPRNVSLFDVDDVTTFGPVRDMTVTRVSAADVDEFCRRWHYTHHKGASAWSYGLWDGFTLVGVVAYKLPTMQVCSSFFGEDRWEWVVHIGRLVCADDAPRNVESRLIAESLRLLKVDRPVARLVVTYAATGVGHIGYVYQATNALYVGMTASAHYYVDTKGQRRSTKQNEGPNRNGGLSIAKARARGWTVHRETPKHRYAYLLGNKAERREARALLRYPVLPYPKPTANEKDTD